MAFNRINGFYVGAFRTLEDSSMSLDERNSEINSAMSNRLEQLNELINSHEKRLKAMTVVSNTFITYSENKIWQDHMIVGDRQCKVGMIKLRGGWRLCHATHEYECMAEGPNHEDWKPLVDCSVEERVAASLHFGRLRDEILCAKERLVPEIEAVIDSLAKNLVRDQDTGDQAPN